MRTTEHPPVGVGFSAEFKQRAVARVRAGETMNAVARDMGCNPITLGQWCKKVGYVGPVVREEVGRLIAIDPAMRGEVQSCVLALRRTLHIVLEALERAVEHGPRGNEKMVDWVAAQTIALRELVAAHQALGIGAPTTTTTVTERTLQYHAEWRQAFVELARQDEVVVEGEVVGEDK